MRIWIRFIAILIFACASPQAIRSQEMTCDQFIAKGRKEILAAIADPIPVIASVTDYVSKKCNSDVHAKADGHLTSLMRKAAEYSTLISDPRLESDPEKRCISNTAVSYAEAIVGIVATNWLGLADAALEGHCFDAADNLYRKVVRLSGGKFQSEIRRAQIGIDDVRSKRRGNSK